MCYRCEGYTERYLISICMVGTPESTSFFESAMQLARRSVGLQYTIMSYGDYFQEFCKVMFSYQYTRKKTKITGGILEWLYEHSAGAASVVVTLIQDAKEIAILNGKEVLNLESLNAAYEQHGLKYPAIAKALNASYETVKAIGEGDMNLSQTTKSTA